MHTTTDPARDDALLDDALRRADEVADRFLVGRKLPGVLYGVTLGDGLIHSRGIGTLRIGEDAPPEIDSVFRIASMTKSFTAATVLSLRDEGLLGLDDPVGRHVPDLAELRGPTTDSPPVTVRHLLSMSAGLPTDDPWGDRQQGLDLDRFADLLRSGPTFAWTPGLRFEYSNLGYGILGRVIASVADREYKDVVRERLLDPLAMDATTFERSDVRPDRLAHGYLWRDDAFEEEPFDPYGALAAMGGVCTSLRDLVRWVGGFVDAFPPRDGPEGPHPLSRATRREMQQIQFAIPSWVEPGAPDQGPDMRSGGYGYGLFIADDPRHGRIVSHSGGYPGFGSNMRWQPSSGLGVIVLINHRYGPATPLGRELMLALLDAGSVVPSPRRIGPAPALVAARAVVETLLHAWDDDLAAASFAMNIDLDEPVGRRRAEMERLRVVHGALTPDPDEPPTYLSSLDASWWMRGERGRVQVGILLSPEPRPLIQDLTLTSIPVPAAELSAAAAQVVAAIDATGGDDMTGSSAALDIALGPAVDRAVQQAIRATGARFGPVRLGPVIAASETSATWRLLGDRGEATLRLERDPATGAWSAIELKTTILERPNHAD